MESLRLSCRSAIYILNTNGPKIDPWETPKCKCSSNELNCYQKGIDDGHASIINLFISDSTIVL